MMDFHTACESDVPRVIVFTVDSEGNQEDVVVEFPIRRGPTSLLPWSAISEAEDAAIAFIKEGNDA